MKIYFSLVLIFAFAVKANAQNSFFDSAYSDGKLTGYGIYDKEHKQWVKYSFYSNGNIADIKRYNSSDFTYKWSITAYHPNGTIALKYSGNSMGSNGIFEEHYSNGNIKRTGSFYNGFKTGEWKEYHPNGKPAASYSYRISERDSILTKSQIEKRKQEYMTIQVGERDPSLGPELEFINIKNYSFPFYISKESGIWRTYDETGKEINKTNHDK